MPEKSKALRKLLKTSAAPKLAKGPSIMAKIDKELTPVEAFAVRACMHNQYSHNGTPFFTGANM